MSICKNIGCKCHFPLMYNHVTFNYKILENFVDDNVERYAGGAHVSKRNDVLYDSKERPKYMLRLCFYSLKACLRLPKPNSNQRKKKQLTVAKLDHSNKDMDRSLISLLS